MSSSGSRAAKRRRWEEHGPSDKQLRLSQFAALRCSESSLVRIVSILQRQPVLIDEVTAGPLAESAEAFAVHLSRSVVPLELDDGSHFNWHVADLGLALKFFAKHSDNFRGLLCRCYREHPCSPDRPWDVVVYNDEAVPGAVLRIDNRRKVVCFYVTIKTWGPKALVHEAAWFPLAYLRHDIVKRVRGKLSAVMKHFLWRVIADREGGVLVDGIGLAGEPALVFWKLGNLLFDESACNATWSSKGANGLLPCVCCDNVYGRMTDQAGNPLSDHDTTGSLVDISCGDPRQFNGRSNDDLWYAADLLTALRPNLTRVQFEEQERLLGLTFNQHGLLWDLDLRPFCPPISLQTYDPSHTFFCSGLLQKEVGLLLLKLKEVGIRFSDVRLFMGADWRTASCLGGGRASSNFASVFSLARERHFNSMKEFSCGASEMLDIVAPLRYFLEVQDAPARRALSVEIASFCALADVVSVLSLAKEGLKVADDLARVLHTHAERFAAAYGDADKTLYIPKFHFARHIPQQIARDGMVLDTLACERYHNRTKNIADPIKNTTRLEASLLGRALQSHLTLLNAPHCFGSGLVNPRAFPDLGECANVALEIVWQGSRIKDGDLVRVDSSPCFVRGCLQIDGEFGLAAEYLTLVEQVTSAASRWTRDGCIRCIALQGSVLRLCVCWTVEANGRVLIVDRG